MKTRDEAKSGNTFHIVLFLCAMQSGNGKYGGLPVAANHKRVILPSWTFSGQKLTPNWTPCISLTLRDVLDTKTPSGDLCPAWLLTKMDGVCRRPSLTVGHNLTPFSEIWFLLSLPRKAFNHVHKFCTNGTSSVVNSYRIAYKNITRTAAAISQLHSLFVLVPVFFFLF